MEAPSSEPSEAKQAIRACEGSILVHQGITLNLSAVHPLTEQEQPTTTSSAAHRGNLKALDPGERVVLTMVWGIEGKDERPHPLDRRN